MKIIGWQKVSYIDFPSNIASVIFTQGCNMKCPFCHNFDIVTDPHQSLLNPETILDYFENNKMILDGIVISGGEPTLQTNLVEFIRTAKSRSAKIKLDTNGSNPDILKRIIEEKLVDYIAMDLKHIWSKYPFATRQPKLTKKVKKSTTLLLQAQGIEVEFRTTVIPGLHREEDILELSTYIPGAKRLTLQSFVPDHATDLKACSWNKECAINYKKLQSQITNVEQVVTHVN